MEKSKTIGNVFECATCIKVYKTRKGMIKHSKQPCSRRQIEQNMKKLYQCYICEKKYASRGALSYHLRKLHDGSGPGVKCLYCKNRFISDSALYNHVLSWHSIQPAVLENDDVFNKCSYCPAIFRSKSGRYYHIQKCHKDKCRSNKNLKERKVFGCCFCSKYFAKKAYRKTHENMCMERYLQNKMLSNTTSSTVCCGSMSNTDNNVDAVPESDLNVTLTFDSLSCGSHDQVDIDTSASVADNQSIDSDVNVAPESDCNITPTIRRYLRDRPSFMRLRTPDVDTPQKARLNLKFGQKTILGYKNKISTLQQKVYRLKAKIKTLNDIISHLVENNEVSDTVADNLEAHYLIFRKLD